MRRGTYQASSDKWIEAEKKHMKEKIRVLTLCAMLFALCVSVDAQQAGKIFRIGFLDQGTTSSSGVLVDAFRQELSKLGASLAGSRERISPLSTDSPSKGRSACLSWRQSW